MNAPEQPGTPAEDTGGDTAEPQPCLPCHGSGKVVSNLGGSPRKVACPWCRGGGVRLVGSDAQEYRREQDAKHV